MYSESHDYFRVTEKIYTVSFVSGPWKKYSTWGFAMKRTTLNVKKAGSLRIHDPGFMLSDFTLSSV